MPFTPCKHSLICSFAFGPNPRFSLREMTVSDDGMKTAYSLCFASGSVTGSTGVTEDEKESCDSR